MPELTGDMKKNFEELKERIEEHQDDFEGIKKSATDLANKLKDAKEGWESGRAEKGDKNEIAKAEETRQTH